MSKLGDNIKFLRIKNNLTLEDLAQKVGVSRQTINRYENSIITNIPSEKIELIANAFNVSPAFLMGWKAHEGNDDNLYSYKNVIPVPKMRKIPFFPNGIACGEPILASEDGAEEIEIPNCIKADFALLCKGDSMINAHIKDGSIVYIKSQPDVDNGSIAAVMVDGEATLKKVYKEKNVLTLMPANESYSPLVFQGSQLADVKILGLATAFTSKL